MPFSLALVLGVVLLATGLARRRAGALLVVASLSLSALFINRCARYQNTYPAIELGTSAEEITARLGKPWANTDCSTTYAGDERTEYDPAPPGCVHEFWYYSFFFPEAWSYAFDDGGRLIHKYEWVSP